MQAGAYMVAVRYPSEKPETPAPRALRVHDGEDMRVLELSPGKTYVVGRAEGAEVPMRSGRVSRMHGILWFKGGRCVFRDLGSANGTFLYDQVEFERLSQRTDGLRIQELGHGEVREIHAGEGLFIGTRRARLELLAEIPAAAWAARDPNIENKSPIPGIETSLIVLDDPTATGEGLDDIEGAGGTWP